jgi:hypothetical protein
VAATSAVSVGVDVAAALHSLTTFKLTLSCIYKTSDPLDFYCSGLFITFEQFFCFISFIETLIMFKG